MKKYLVTILTISLGIFLCNSMFAQETATNWADVIAEEKGDTVVVMGFESSFYFNTMLTAVKGDTTPDGERTNPNRIYETIPGETYISDVTLELDATVPLLHITAPEPAPGVRPPLFIRSNKQDGTFDKTLFQSPGSTLMENQYFLMATVNETFDREFMRCLGVGTHHEYRNCIFELTNWTHHVPMANRQTYKYTDCKFINVGNEATLEKGCVLETRTVPPDTVWMENCTFLNGGILVLALETTGPMFVYFNHNTIVNVSQPPLCFPAVAEMVVTNNLFVNAGFVADYPTFYTLFDDDDLLPKGIVNMDTIENEWIQNWYLDENNESFYPVDEADRKVLFDNNSAWWDPRFETMVTSQMTPIDPVSCGEYEWMSQMILMNDRTQDMFDDDASYPYLTEGDNISIQPDFTTNEDIIDQWISYVITNSTPCAPNGGDLMPKWRTNLTSLVYVPDWPMLADLTYTDATLLSAGYGGVPLGDLNWFPADKATWNANEQDMLINALKAGTLPAGISEKMATSEFKYSVYPNPFSEATNVNFELNRGSNVKLNICNLVGGTVSSIDLGYQLAGSNTITIDRGDLKPGLYILQIITDNVVGVTTKITVN